MSKHRRSAFDDEPPDFDRRETRDDVLDDALLLAQVRDVLTPMPEVNRRAIADILAAVAVRKPSRVAQFREGVRFAIERFYMVTSPLSRGTALATVALMVGFVARGALPMRDGASVRPDLVATGDRSEAVTTAPPSVVTTTVEGAAERASLRVPVQFVFDTRALADVRTIAVVGDFNDWNAAATPLTREGSVWSTSLPLTPGRHVYAFVVNGTQWIADPRAPRAVDADFGRPGSVIIVQSP